MVDGEGGGPSAASAINNLDRGRTDVDTVTAPDKPRKKRKHRKYATLSPEAKRTRNRANKRRLRRRAKEAACRAPST